jgi:hypothetical protein
MAFSTGVAKQVFYKKETTWGTLAGTGSAKTLRRVTASFNLTKETYESGEIRTDFQIADVRHGVRSVDGSLNAELSPGAYSDFIAAALAKDFAAVAAPSAAALTIAGTGPYTIARAAGSFLTDGFKIGDVVRITVAGNANNINKNLLVTGVVALTLTVVVLNGSTMTAETTGATAVISVVGKKTYAPLTGHTDDSFTFEEFYSDILQSEVFTGVKVNTVSLALPATGLVTADFGFMGKNLEQTGTSQYFVSPAAQGTAGIFAAVNGMLMINGTAVALLTGLNVNISRNISNATVVGSNSIAQSFEGRIKVDGDFSAYFEDATVRDMFKDETEASIVMVLTTSSAAAADFMTIVLPRIKVNSNTRDDGEQGIVAQHSFQALLNTTGGTGISTEKTTIVVQDSLA